MAAWEKELIGKGYKPRTAREARKLLSAILGDAVPRYIKVNPAARKRSKGRKRDSAGSRRQTGPRKYGPRPCKRSCLPNDALC